MLEFSLEPRFVEEPGFKTRERKIFALESVRSFVLQRKKTAPCVQKLAVSLAGRMMNHIYNPLRDPIKHFFLRVAVVTVPNKPRISRLRASSLHIHPVWISVR